MNRMLLGLNRILHRMNRNSIRFIENITDLNRMLIRFNRILIMNNGMLSVYNNKKLTADNLTKRSVELPTFKSDTSAVTYKNEMSMIKLQSLDFDLWI